jgi:acyl-CoA thioester hydrolase
VTTSAPVAEPFIHRIRVRYGEVDMQRVVFNAHYLSYCDDACECFVGARGVRPELQDWDFMLKKAVVEWAGTATVHDELAIAVAVTRWGNTSFDMTFKGSVAERPVFTATITYVGVRAGTTETMRVPDVVRELLGTA